MKKAKEKLYDNTMDILQTRSESRVTLGEQESEMNTGVMKMTSPLDVNNNIEIKPRKEEDSSLAHVFKEYAYNAEHTERQLHMQIKTLKTDNKRKEDRLKELNHELECQRAYTKNTLKNLEKSHEKSLHQMNSLLQQKSDEISILNTQVDNLTQKLKLINEKKGDTQESKDNVSKQNEEVEILKKKLHATEFERQQVTLENESNIKLLGALKQKERQHINNMKAGVEECKRIMQMYKSSEHYRQEMKQQLVSLTTENEKLMRDSVNAKELKDLLAGKFESLMKKSFENTDTSFLQEENENLKKDINGISEELTMAKKSQSTLTIKVDELEQSLQKRNEKICNLEKEISEGRIREENLQTEIFEFKKKENNFDKEEGIANGLKELRLSSQAIEKQFRMEKYALLDEIKKLKNIVSQYCQQIENQSKEIAEHQAQVDNLNKTINKNQELSEQRETQSQILLKDVSDKNAVLKSKIAELSQLMRKLNSQLESKEKKLAKTMNLLKISEQKCEEYSLEISELQTQLQNAEKLKQNTLLEMNTKVEDVRKAHVSNVNSLHKQLECEKRNLQSLIDSAQQDVNRYKSETEKLNERNNILQDELSRVMTSFDDVKANLSLVTSQKETVQLERNKEYQKHTEMKYILKQLDTENQKLEANLQVVMNERDDLLNDLKTSEDIHKKDINMVFHLQSALAILENEYQVIKNEMKIKDETLQNHVIEISRLKDNLEKKEEDVNSKHVTYEQLKVDYHRIYNEHAECETIKKILNENLQRKMLELEVARSKSEAEFQSEIEQLKYKNNSYATAITELKSALKSTDKERESTSAKLKKITQNYDELLQEFKNLTVSSGNDQVKLKESQKQIETFRDDHSKLSIKLSEREDELSARRRDIETLEKRLLETEYREKELITSVENHYYENIIREQKQNLKSAENRISELTQNEKKYEKDQEQLNAKLFDLTSKLSHYGKDYETKQEELNALKGYVKEVQGVLEGNEQKHQWVTERDRVNINEIQQLRKLVSDHQNILLQDKEKIMKLEFDAEKLRACLTTKENENRKLSENLQLFKMQFKSLCKRQKEKIGSTREVLEDMQRKESKLVLENDQLKQIQHKLEVELSKMKMTLQSFKNEHKNCLETIEAFRTKEECFKDKGKVLEEKTKVLHREFMKSVNACKTLKLQNASLTMMFQDMNEEKDHYETFLRTLRKENDNLRTRLNDCHSKQQILRQELEITNSKWNERKIKHENKKVEVVKPRDEIRPIDSHETKITTDRQVLSFSEVFKLADRLKQSNISCKKSYSNIEKITNFPKNNPIPDISNTIPNKTNPVLKRVKRKRLLKKPDNPKISTLDKTFSDWKSSFHNLLNEMNDLSCKLTTHE